MRDTSTNALCLHVHALVHFFSFFVFSLHKYSKTRRGIEHGYVEHGFVADTRKFFKKLRQQKDLESHIHVVWYVIDLTQARFQPFEAEFCRKNLEDIPIIFVFNKADAVKPEIRDLMMKTVSDFNLRNCRGLFATVADCKNFDRDRKSVV